MRRLATGTWGGLAMALAAVTGCGQPQQQARSISPVVVIETSAGTIRAELWPDKSPVTVENFLRYVDEGFYDNTIFHRCIRAFMIQGGGFTPEWRKKRTREPIRNEANNGLRNMRGTLAMARSGEVHSATAQFFINTVDNRSLDHGVRDYGYAVFGQVIAGMDVVIGIERAPVVDDPEQQGRPAKPVIIKSIRRAGIR